MRPSGRTVDNVSIFLRSGTLLMQAYLPTESGLSIATGPVHTAPDGDPAAAAEALRAVLSQPHRVLPHPEQSQWKAVEQPMLEAAGVRSWKTLSKGCKAVAAVLDGSHIRLTPTAHYEQAGGQAMEDQAVEIDVNDKALGTFLLEAFARCR